MKKQFFEVVLRKKYSLREPMASRSSLRALCMALLMTLCISNAWADDVASVTFDGTTTNYSSFQDAMDYANTLASTNDKRVEITLLKNCSGGLTVNANKYMTLYGGSYTLTTGMTIHGNLTIMNGTYKALKGEIMIGVSDSSNPCLTINGGTIDASTADYAICVQIGKCIINDGVIKGKNYGLCLNHTKANLTLNKAAIFANTSIYVAVITYNVSRFIGSGKTCYKKVDNAWQTCSTNVTRIDSPIFVTGNEAVSVVTANGDETLYDSFSKAINAANTAGEATVNMWSDCSVTAATVMAGNDITLSGGTHTLTLENYLSTEGDLTITDGTFNAPNARTVSCVNVDNDGTLTLNGGTFYGLVKSISFNNGKPVVNALGAGKTFLNYTGDVSYTSYVSSSDYTVKVGDCTQSYTRNVTSGNYGSICIPYASNSWTGVDKVYEVTDVSSSSVTLSEVKTMLAGTPYLFKSNASTVSFKEIGGAQATHYNDYLTGNFEPVYVPAGNYVLQNNQFCKVVADNTIKSGSYRCYLNDSKVPSSEETKAIMLDINDEDDPGYTEIGEEEVPLSIGEVMTSLNDPEAAIYDLNGRRLQSFQKGINIINGKKVIVK